MVFHRSSLRTFLLVLTLFGMAVVASPVAEAAVITVVNNDGPGEGFNDPTPVAPVGGNSGTSIGQQRLIAFQRAAEIWAGLISSPVEIRIGANFDPLACNSTSGILGSAGPVSFVRDFTNAPVTDTWFPVALANALAGSDLDPGRNDISARFNSSVGTPGCLDSLGWFYGLDADPPNGTLDLVTVVLHELGHGLGFLTIVDPASGAKALGRDDTFMRFLEDHLSTKLYPAMTDAERVVASTDTGNLHWVGAHVRAASGVLTAGKVGDHVQMFAPNPPQPGSSVSHWDAALTPNLLMEPVYTGSIHNPVLELPLFQDIGWTLLAPPPPPPPPSSTNLLPGFPADYDGDGKTDIVVYRPSTGFWFIIQSSNGSVGAAQWGAGGDQPVPGDYDGDHKSDIAVYRPSTGFWFIVQSSTGSVRAVQWGAGGDRPVPGDYDGDHKTDVAVYRPSTGVWFILQSSTGSVRTQTFGASGDIPVPGDYDGDGKADIAVYRPSTGVWFILRSSDGVVQQQQWGAGGDQPLPGEF